MSKPPSKMGETPSTALSEESIAQKLTPFLRPEKRQAGVEMVAMMVQKTHRGPLPAPESFEHYDAVLPGSAERILAMAEKEQAHRHGSEDRVIRHEYTTRYLGQIGAILALCVLAGLVAYCATIGQPIAATVIGAIGGVIIAFLRHTHNKLEGQLEQSPQRDTKAVNSKRRAK